MDCNLDEEKTKILTNQLKNNQSLISLSVAGKKKN